MEFTSISEMSLNGRSVRYDVVPTQQPGACIVSPGQQGLSVPLAPGMEDTSPRQGFSTSRQLSSWLPTQVQLLSTLLKISILGKASFFHIMLLAQYQVLSFMQLKIDQV